MSATPAHDNQPILEVSDLSKHFPVQRSLVGALRREEQRIVRAIDGVSFGLRRGEVLGMTESSAFV
jgi:ABC-type oligopeptide transport system ATPase subunit